MTWDWLENQLMWMSLCYHTVHLYFFYNSILYCLLFSVQLPVYPQYHLVLRRLSSCFNVSVENWEMVHWLNVICMSFVSIYMPDVLCHSQKLHMRAASLVRVTTMGSLTFDQEILSFMRQKENVTLLKIKNEECLPEIITLRSFSSFVRVYLRRLAMRRNWINYFYHLGPPGYHVNEIIDLDSKRWAISHWLWYDTRALLHTISPS